MHAYKHGEEVRWQENEVYGASRNFKKFGIFAGTVELPGDHSNFGPVRYVISAGSANREGHFRSRDLNLVYPFNVKKMNTWEAIPDIDTHRFEYKLVDGEIQRRKLKE